MDAVLQLIAGKSGKQRSTRLSQEALSAVDKLVVARKTWQSRIQSRA